MLTKFICASISVLAMMGAVEAQTPNMPPPPAGSTSTARFDAPLTVENSVLFDFGYGKTLRVPKMLFDPDMLPKDLRQSMHGEAISMTFIFPDMTEGEWISKIEKANARWRPGYVAVSQPHRFPVHIRFLYFSPDNIDGLPPGPPPLYPRPAELHLNYNCKDFEKNPCIPLLRPIKTPLKGIDALARIDHLASDPGESVYRPKKEYGYVNKPGMSYELTMYCDPYDGIECKANVYEHRHQFQYQMLFPPEAVSHTDEIIRAIDRLLDQWSHTRLNVPR